MASFLTLPMIEQEYLTTQRVRKKCTLTFPSFGVSGTQSMPDSDSETKQLSADRSARIVIGADTRSKLNDPHIISYAKHNGLIESKFTQDDGSVIIRRGTGFVFANDWVMTAALNMYDPETDTFADSIVYYPGLGGNIENPPYGPVDITKALIPELMLPAYIVDDTPDHNIAFLKLDPSAAKPEGYNGFRYQSASYRNERAIVVGYPGDLPAEAADTEKGISMYRSMGKVNISGISFLYHDTDTSSVGYAGSPLYMNWADGNGFVAIAMNAYEDISSNIAIKLSNLMYGSMKMIRQGGLDQEIPYVQPDKGDSSSLENIVSLIDVFRTIGQAYANYYYANSHELKYPTKKQVVVGVTSYLRSFGYDGIIWAAALLDIPDSGFAEYVLTNCPNEYERLQKYIKKDGRNSLRDNGFGNIDLAHLAATLEGHAAISSAPDYWTGWGGDLASGMSKTSDILGQKPTYEPINNAVVTQVAQEIIGLFENSPCNYSDFCCDFDAIKLADMVDSLTDGDTIEVQGNAFAELIDAYYNTNLASNRFQYVFSDLNCSIDSDLETIYHSIYTKLTGTAELLGLLTSFGGNPSGQVIEACCWAFANYIKLEVS